ncbi:hypothetical protein MTY66_63120 (plasmid) [Mycolicibacterium sp. TY66]|jgi:hypothetical protein|nr:MULTISPECIES: hypothetical protein [unclassified Mycolicibacterium]BCI84687.1 hypothetical protein MTY66_63120 [Mycolicibacterium sp. TY66]BCJ84916.1 hypothetical protein MTY81_62890 [Mycolicibacterium sp. TY81]
MNVIIDQRTGAEVNRFSDYVEAAVYRRDVLRPRLHPDQPCPYAIRGVPA